MSENKRGIATDLKALDAHIIKPDEYEDAPELTDEQLAAAGLHEGGKLTRRGRPPSETRKQPVKIRLDPDLVAALRASGPGWQTRLNAFLREALLRANRGGLTTLKARLRGESAKEAVRATAKRRKDEARQRRKKAHLKKARA
jgi:uncharacterized protein (DUF4415 family)